MRVDQETWVWGLALHQHPKRVASSLQLLQLREGYDLELPQSLSGIAPGQ